MTTVNNHRSQNKQRKKIRNEKPASVYLEVDKLKYFKITPPFRLYSFRDGVKCSRFALQVTDI